MHRSTLGCILVSAAEDFSSASDGHLVTHPGAALCSANVHKYIFYVNCFSWEFACRSAELYSTEEYCSGALLGNLMQKSWGSLPDVT